MVTRVLEWIWNVTAGKGRGNLETVGMVTKLQICDASRWPLWRRTGRGENIKTGSGRGERWSWIWSEGEAVDEASSLDGLLVSR